MRTCLQGRAILSALLVSISAAPSALGQVAGAIGNCAGNVHVRMQVDFKNKTGQDANDLHFRMFQMDRKGIKVEGGQVNGGAPFTNAQLGFTKASDKPTNRDGENHGVNADLSGGTVGSGESIKLELVLCLNEENNLKIDSAFWTKDGQNIGKAQFYKHGARVSRPDSGGNGGNRQDPGGGGRGAQEGNGGAGNFVHKVIIENDDVQPMRLRSVKLLASMTYYPGMEFINWVGIDSLVDIPPGGVDIPPNGVWSYQFATTGSYLGGQIYMKYTLRDISGPPFSRSPGGEEFTSFYFDHPPDSICMLSDCMVCDTIPTLTEWGMIIMFVVMAAGIIWFVVRQRRRMVTT